MIRMPYEVEVSFTDLASVGFVRLDATTEEVLEAIKTGLMKNKSITAIKLFAVNGTEESHSFVYNIAAAKSGQQPWSIECQQPS